MDFIKRKTKKRSLNNRAVFRCFRGVIEKGLVVKGIVKGYFKICNVCPSIKVQLVLFIVLHRLGRFESKHQEEALLTIELC